MSTKGGEASVLKLSDPAGTAAKGNAVLGVPSIEDRIAEKEQLADNQNRIQELEKNNADLEKVIEQRKRIEAKSKSGGAGKTRHIAHAEGWQAVCTAPDLCKVGKDIVAFNSFATLDTKITASANVKARGTAVYRKGDVIKNVKGDAGKHIVSGTSLGSGHVKILDGHENVKINGIPAARHDSRCLINCDASGGGGAQGKIVTEQKSVRSGGDSAAANPGAPPGERTSANLEFLRNARAKIAAGMLDLNAIDEYVNFKDSNRALDSLIGEISGAPGTTAGYAAQAARGLLGFTKDLVMGVGELAYEGVKTIPKLVRLTHTQSGKLLTQIDAQILVENIKLGNISPGTVGHAVLDIGKAVVQPVTGPWAKGQYVESVTRGAAEVGTLGLGWLKGSKAARTAKAVAAAKTAEAAKVEAVVKTADVLDIARPAEIVARRADDGVHIAQGPRRARPAPNGFAGPDGYKTHGIQDNPLHSPEGRKLVDQYKAQGMTDGEALDKALELQSSGATLPKAMNLLQGDTLYKIVPEGSMPSQYSPFFARETEIRLLTDMSFDQIADRFGLPLESQQALRFDVVKITANQPVTMFESIVAHTTQNGYAQPGGAIQILTTNRNAFSNPILTGIKFP